MPQVSVFPIRRGVAVNNYNAFYGLRPKCSFLNAVITKINLWGENMNG